MCFQTENQVNENIELEEILLTENINKPETQPNKHEQLPTGAHIDKEKTSPVGNSDNVEGNINSSIRGILPNLIKVSLAIIYITFILLVPLTFHDFMNVDEHKGANGKYQCHYSISLK